MSNYDGLRAPCGCSLIAYDEGPARIYPYELQPCALHGAAGEMLDVLKHTLNVFLLMDEDAPRLKFRIEAAIKIAEGRS